MKLRGWTRGEGRNMEKNMGEVEWKGEKDEEEG